MSEADEVDHRSLRNGLRQLAQRPDLIERLRASESSAEAMRELRLNGDSARRDVLNVVGGLQVASPRDHEPAPIKDVEGIREFFTEAFRQVQRAYRISMGMSVTMFAAGLVFLGIAAWKSVLHPDQVAATSVVGGIGVLQIVALFYRNPLADIARSLTQ